MGVIAQYETSVAFPAIVGGTGTTLKYFGQNPPASLWNTGVTGVAAPISSNNYAFGFTPSATNASGQLQIFTGNGVPSGVTFVGGQVGSGKILGNRFRVYASGEASSVTGVPTITPIIQLNKGSIGTPSYVTLGGAVASAALVANQPVSWSIACDIELGPSAAAIHGYQKFTFVSSAGTATNSAAEALITPVTGLTLTNPQGLAGFGLVVGITFSASDATNTASLYEFKVVQD